MIGVVGVLIGKIIIQESFDNRPFKFEKYKTDEELEEAAKLRFPVGTKLDQISSELEKSGAKCHSFKPSDQPDNYEIIMDCEYNTNLISLHFFERYGIGLAGDKDHKLIELEAQRISGPMLYIP